MYNMKWNKTYIVGNILTIALLMISCDVSKGNSNDQVVQHLKEWHYYEGEYHEMKAELFSTNYYSTEINENIYMAITLGSSGMAYLSFFVVGTPKDKEGTVMGFIPQNYVLISFDKAKSEIWYVSHSPSNSVFVLNNFDDFIGRLKKSHTCTIFADTNRGHVTYDFDTRNLLW